ncbi:MAG: GerMN domain-containing protein [Sphaerochaeta sp.]|jgi:hypothetical protein
MKAEKPNYSKSLLIFLIWILFTIAVLLIGFSKVKAAVTESGVLTLLANRTEAGQAPSQTRLIKSAFILPDGTPKLFSHRTARLGGSANHDTFEALLAPLPLEALEEGAISYIHPSTRLRGLTLSSSILFVDFSKEYLDSIDLRLADLQVTQTALAISGIKGVRILIDGNVRE